MSVVQKLIAEPAIQTPLKMAAPETEAAASMPSFAGDQAMCRLASAYASTAAAWAALARRLSCMSLLATWRRPLSGRTRNTSNVPILIIWPSVSSCPTTKSVTAKLMPARPYRNATSGSDQPPSRGRWWKMTRIARNSDTPATTCATKSSPKVSRYWARARMDAAARRRYVVSVASVSATLDHQLPNGRRQQEPASQEKGCGPPCLEGEGTHQVEALVLAQEDVDRDLEEAREGQGQEHAARACRQKVERDQQAGKKGPRQRRHVQDSAIVQQPEGGQVDDEAEAEAQNGCQHHRDGEHEPATRVGRDMQWEQDGADQDRRDSAEDGVEERAPEVAGEPVALEVDGAAEVDGDVAADDPQRELVPAPDVDDHDQALRQPDVGESV